MHTAIPDVTQQRLVQQFLDLRAVPGSSIYFDDANLQEDSDDAIALKQLSDLGWVQRFGDGRNWQLTLQPLQRISVQFCSWLKFENLFEHFELNV